jgi:hypothetical protein
LNKHSFSLKNISFLPTNSEPGKNQLILHALRSLTDFSFRSSEGGMSREEEKEKNAKKLPVLSVFEGCVG